MIPKEKYLDEAELATECAECGQLAVRMTIEQQPFVYGVGGEAVELSARVPVWTCSACGFGVTDGSAEDLRHEAVCNYKGVLTPKEILDLRQRLQISRADLSKLTGFGEASIKRWESGLLIQNASSDRMLRLLEDPTVVAKLREFANSSLPSSRREPVKISGQFRTQLSPSIHAEAAVFCLRACG
jgi:putative zinc finger/helix-turn-helix YgiT family protein